MPTLLLSLVALIEWFSTLAVEIIAIRLATPIVGSSIILTSIFLWTILLALSAGYYVGGSIASRITPKRLLFLLGIYLIGAGAYYLFLSFAYERELIEIVLQLTQDYILTLFVAAFLLFFIPVFVASQTLPILTELIPETSKGKAAGRILFISTIGSFLGSVLTSTVFFQEWWVYLTGTVVGISLFVAAALLWITSFPRGSLITIIGASIVARLLIYHRPAPLPGVVYWFDSAYQEILIKELSYQGDPAKIFMTNGAFSSGIDPRTKKSFFEYIKQTRPIVEDIRPARILVIWTAGFSFPQEVAQYDRVQQIDAVDIDPSVKAIAEQYFLEAPLSEKITFYPESARYFINQAKQAGKKYDFILVDAYNGTSLPEDLTTYEFFKDLRHISANQHIVFNLILDKDLVSNLAQRLLTTLHRVYPSLYYRKASTGNGTITNFLVTTQRFDSTYATYQPIYPHRTDIYTDDRRSVEVDTIALYRTRTKR